MSTTLLEHGSGKQRVLVFGATGTIGQATVRQLLARGHDVTCFLRARPDEPGADRRDEKPPLFEGAELYAGDVTDPLLLRDDNLIAQPFDAIVSCMASRTGAPKDAWAIDYQAHMNVLAMAQAVDIPRMVLLSAICVQKPRLAFQHAKLAFEKALIESGLTYSIVRPTAYFKSLSGQIDRLRAGRPFLVLGDGRLTACKPISDDDLGAYLADCLNSPDKDNRILPIGGPGPAITPREQGERLFELLGRPPKFRQMPVAAFGAIVASLGAMGRVIPSLAEKAELARIGQYYATESMLVWDEAAGRYDADATPEFGTKTLFEFYREIIENDLSVARGDHAVF